MGIQFAVGTEVKYTNPIVTLAEDFKNISAWLQTSGKKQEVQFGKEQAENFWNPNIKTNSSMSASVVPQDGIM